MAAGLTLNVGVATDVGRVREHNEDSAFAQAGVYVVADGMGGHAAGEIASRITADTLGELAGRDGLKVADFVRQIETANWRILAAAGQDPSKNGMATTVTGVALVTVGGSPHWAVLNLGDSRVYRYLNASLAQVTVDHSEVQELVDAGFLTDAEARVHPLRLAETEQPEFRGFRAFPLPHNRTRLRGPQRKGRRTAYRVRGYRVRGCPIRE